MKTDNLRNFTVRFLESALRRVEATAKPFYGGRLSTGEAIRRLAEERLDAIESEAPRERTRDALLRILRAWRSGHSLSLADLRFLSDKSNTAYQRCRREFVLRELLVANVSAFREAVQLAKGGKTGKGIQPEERYFLGNLATSRGTIEGKTLPESVDKWLELLPELPSASQGEFASRNLLTYLRDEEFSDESRLSKTLGPYIPALLQLAIRGYWISERSALVESPKEPPTWPMHMNPIQRGRISLSAIVGEHDVTLAMDSSAHHSVITANHFVEVEDLAEMTRLAVAGHELRGETFVWLKLPEPPARFMLKTERAVWIFDAEDFASFGQCLDSLFREPSVAALVERLRYAYGRI
jgi:hypothetical protein